MEPAEKIAAIAESCRRDRYLEPFVQGVVAYLQGHGSLSEVQRQWQLARANNSYLWPYTLGHVSVPPSGSLDPVDLRILETYHAIGSLWIGLGPIASYGLIEPARDHLLRHGVSEQDFLDACLQIIGSAIDSQQRVTPLGPMLLGYVPDRFHQLVQSTLRTRHGDVWTTLVALLLSADPPETEQFALKSVAFFLKVEQYRHLAVELSLSPHSALAQQAVALLRRQPFDDIRAALQHCVAEGVVEAALDALAVLMSNQWEGQQVYLLSLLAHRSKQIRAVVAKALIASGEAALDTLAPLLSHKSANARIAAVEILGKIGGERMRALLGAQLDVERSEKVRRAIIDVIGVPEVTQSDDIPVDTLAAFVAEATATMRRIRQRALPWLDPAEARLCWADARSVPSDVVAYILYRQSRFKELQLDRSLRPALAALDGETAAEWALELWNGWIGHDQQAKTAWCITLASALGDDRLVASIRTKIEEWTKANRGAVAARAVHALAALGTDLALSEVDSIASRAKHAQVSFAAQQALRDAARRARLTTEELADRIVPRLGFDVRGERVLDYGGRRLTVRLGLDLTLHLRDEQGATITTLPKPGKGDNPEHAAAAQASWKQIKAQLKQAVKLQTERLERALVGQRAWEVGRWQALFLGHPLLRGLAVRLVWLVETPDRPPLLFRPLEDGPYTDADDEQVELPSSGNMRLAHPVCLDEETLGAWQRHLADYEIRQPFAQISRPIVRMLPEECDAIFWTAYEGYLMNGGALKGRYLKAGWERGGVGDGGGYYALLRRFPGAGLIAVLETAGLWRSMLSRSSTLHSSDSHLFRSWAMIRYGMATISCATMSRALSGWARCRRSSSARRPPTCRPSPPLGSTMLSGSARSGNRLYARAIAMSTTLHVSERIAAIAKACRRDYFPEPLLAVICQYLCSQAVLADVQREWYGARIHVYGFNYLMLRGLVGLHLDQLDDIDRRMLDVCGVIDRLPIFFFAIADSGPVTQARDYLISEGMSDLDILAVCVEV